MLPTDIMQTQVTYDHRSLLSPRPSLNSRALCFWLGITCLCWQLTLLSACCGSGGGGVDGSGGHQSAQKSENPIGGACQNYIDPQPAAPCLKAINEQKILCQDKNKNSCWALGNLYVHGGETQGGTSIDPDWTKARPYLQQACDLHEEKSCYTIGGSILGEIPTRSDEQHAWILETSEEAVEKIGKAVKVLEIACNREHDQSCNEIGNIYAYSKAVRDYEKAAEYLEKACSASPEALSYLSSYDFFTGSSCVLLGRIYYKGLSGSIDYSKARGWLTKTCAAKQGGCSELGEMFEKGLGVERDVSKALSYFEKGCATKIEPSACRGARRVMNQ